MPKTLMQKYALSVSHGPETRDAATPPPSDATIVRVSTATEARGSTRQATKLPSTTRTIPVTSTIVWVWTREVRKNPVPNVPTSAPNVPAPDSLPTVRPVAVRCLQLLLDDDGRDAAENERGQEERRAGERDDGLQAVAVDVLAEELHQRS